MISRHFCDAVNPLGKGEVVCSIHTGSTTRAIESVPSGHLATWWDSALPGS
jgi:hypothetical protein